MPRHLTTNALRSGRLFHAAAAILFALTFSAGPVRAEGDVFEVNNVAVDVKADTAADARRQALIEAERRAFYTLIARLTLSEDQERIPEFSREDIASYVRDFSVANEKASSVRYIARLNYRFNADAVRNLLRAYNVPFAETRSKPMVILPVYEVGGTAVLWDEPNPWRDAWSARSGPEGLVPKIVPLGDLLDISSVGVAEAMVGNPLKLGTLAERYGAAGTIVAYNRIGADTDTGRQIAAVTLIRPSDPIPDDQKTVSYPQAEGENAQAFMQRVTEATADRIENLWKRRNLIVESATGILAVTVPITGLKDWLQIKEQFSRIGIVRQTDVVLMSREQVRVNIHYAGDPDQLMTALEQSNLSLSQESGEWIVMPIGVFQPPRT